MKRSARQTAANPGTIARRPGKRCLSRQTVFAVFCATLLAAYAAALFSLATFFAQDSAPPPQAVIDWVRANAIPLKTVEAGNGFEDMRPLGKTIGDARIVALGEATHGTREFFQLKHRMVEYLATELGFSVFAIEANMPEAYRVNDFIENGTGDPKKLLKGMYFWTWDTQEVLDMILWMRKFNQSGRGHIRFAGFDMQSPEVPLANVRSFVVRYDVAEQEVFRKAQESVAALRKSDTGQPGFGVVTATFPVEAAAGKHITYSGYIRTEGITKGYAGLWWRVDGEPGKVLAFDNMQDRGAKGTTPWTRYEISLDVPLEAKNINFGVLHPGNGTAWFDSLRVEIDGKPYTDSSAFDFDFESAAPRGFITHGAGYEIGLDKEVAQNGSQSLRIKFVRKPVKPSESEIRNFEAAARQLVEQLQERRPTLLERAGEKETDWAVQNARLIEQFVEVKAGKKTRDECMAENVEWIAAHSSGTKLVLWAHNGHIAYRSGYGAAGNQHKNDIPQPMGWYLHRMFGKELVNFGFAFNEGSFRAFEMGKGLHESTVGPAPTGSLDRALADAKIPILALDLRRVPAQGPVAEFFRGSHASRSIGAMYSSSVAKFLWNMTPACDSYDALLFVEKTTAARGN